MVIADALDRGEQVYHVAFGIDPHCPMRGAAMQLIRNVLQECGRLLAIAPDQSTLTPDLDVVEAAVSSEHPQDWLEKKCRIPAVTSEILVRRAGLPAEPGDDMLDILQHVIAPVDDGEPVIAAEEIPVSAVTPPAEPAPALKAHNGSETLPAANSSAPTETTVSFSGLSENLLRVDAERIDAVLNLVG